MSQEKRKHIRPLKAFTKANPEYVQRILRDCEDDKLSKRGKDRKVYYELGFGAVINAKNKVFGKTIGNEHFSWEAWFGTTWFQRNKCTLVEIGQLYLHAWYYGKTDFSEELAIYIFNAFNKKVKAGERFNDSEFSQLVKHLRENIGYYFHNPDKAKLKIIKALFPDELKKINPPRNKELAIHYEVESIIEARIKHLKSKGVESIIEDIFSWEEYSLYLMELLGEYDIPFMSLNEYKESEKEDNEKYFKEICEIEEQQENELLNRINVKFALLNKPEMEEAEMEEAENPFKEMSEIELNRIVDDLSSFSKSG